MDLFNGYGLLEIARMKEGVCELLFMKFWWICLLLQIQNFRSEILVIFVVYDGGGGDDVVEFLEFFYGFLMKFDDFLVFFFELFMLCSSFFF